MPRRPTEGIFDEGGVFGPFAEALGGHAQAYGAAFQRLAAWGQQFLAKALPKVQGVINEEAPCEVEHVVDGHASACPLPAFCRCGYCRRTACEGHAYMGSDGSSICIACVRQVNPRAQGPKAPSGGAGPRPRREAPRPAEGGMSIDAALRVLGCTRRDDWDTVRAAHKKLAAEFHPDRHGDKPAEERAKMLERMKLINAAYERLKEARQSA